MFLALERVKFTWMEENFDILDAPHFDERKYEPQRIIYGSFGNRFVAALLDGLIVGIPMVGMNFFMMGVTPLDKGLNFMPTIINVIVGWLYSALQESSYKQATIGKRAMNLKVTDLYGNQISFAQASGRHFAKILSGCMLLIGYLMAAFTERNQALHDMIAGTLVLDNRENRYF